MKKQMIIFSLIILLTSGIVFFSLHQNRGIEKEVAKTEHVPEKEEPAATTERKEIVPSRPEDYGVIIIDEGNKPKTQEEWDKLFSQKIKELKTEFPAETWNEINEKIKEDPLKKANTMKEIDENIAKCKKILDKEPHNKEIKDKLERLMMLKSIGKEL